MQLTLICFRGLNSGFKFIFRFKSKFRFDGVGVGLYNGSVIMDQRTTCTSKLKGNLQNKKEKAKHNEMFRRKMNIF